MNTQPNREYTPVNMEELLYMRERVFWQSRANLPDPPRLVDLHVLASMIRSLK